MLNVTNHALERGCERLWGMNDTLGIKQHIAQNRDKIIEDINKLFEHSILIWTGQINGDKTTKNYYLRDNIVLVVDTNNTTIVTLYRVDFGFNEDIDRMIVNNLVTEITKLQGEIETKKTEIVDEIDRKKTEVMNIDSEIDSLKQQLFMLELKKTNVEGQIKVAYNDVEIKNKQLEVHALKICNSLEYKKEIIKLNGGR